MRIALALLLVVVAADAQPPLSPGFQRLKELRRAIEAKITELREREAFDKKPREERMLLAFRAKKAFEGDELDARHVVEACLAWDEVARAVPTEAGKRVLDLLPVVLEEHCGRQRDKKDQQRRRQPSIPLLKALDSDHLPVREAAIASLRRLYDPPRVDRYDAASPPKDRRAPIRAWQRAVSDQNW